MIKQLMLIALTCGVNAMPINQVKKSSNNTNEIISIISATYHDNTDSDRFYLENNISAFDNLKYYEVKLYLIEYKSHGINIYTSTTNYSAYFTSTYLKCDDTDLCSLVFVDSDNNTTSFDSGVETIDGLNIATKFAIFDIGFTFTLNNVDYDIMPLSLTHYLNGYNAGELQHASDYQDGYNAGLNSTNVLKDGILTIPDAFISIIKGLLNFNILGINIFGLVCGVLTIALVVFIIKKVKG